MKARAAFLFVTASLLLPALGSAQIVEYYSLDAIGNVRVVTDQQGKVIERHDYLPFGEECTTGPCANNPGFGAGQARKFTGKERDAESGLDYFGARYYGSKVGRFTTVDPAYVISANLVDPQLWNRYSYVRNNPLRHTDPDGRLIDILADLAAIEYDLLDIAVTLYTRGDVTGTHYKALGGDVLGAVIPGLTGVGVAVRSGKTIEDILGAFRRGRKSEERVLDALGEAKNTAKVKGKEGASIPDYQNSTTVGEIKDAARVDNTRQIRIQREAAQASGREHVVQTGTGTKVGGKVEKSGSVVKRRDDLGPKTQ